MKNRFLNLAASVLALAIAHSAMADDHDQDHDHGDPAHFHSILHSCNISFHATGKSIYVGIGYTDLNGEGTLSCYDLVKGTTVHIPLRVTARGPGAGLGVTGLVLSGGATGIGISSGPEALLGHYVMARANAAAGVGAAAGLGFRLSNGSASIDATVQAQTGLGAGIDLLWINIEAANGERKEVKSADNNPPPPPVIAQASPQPASAVPTSTVKVRDGQAIALMDGNGHLLQLIYVNRQ